MVQRERFETKAKEKSSGAHENAYIHAVTAPKKQCAMECVMRVQDYRLVQPLQVVTVEAQLQRR